MVVVVIGMLPLEREEVVIDHALGQFKVVFFDELADQLAVQALLGHVCPTIADLLAEVLAQVAEGLELLAEVFGELVVELGQGAFAHLVGCHREVHGSASVLVVGRVLSVGEANLALFASIHADEGFCKLGAELVLVDEEVALLVLIANDGQAAVVEPLQIRDEHIALGRWPLDDSFGGVATAQLL